jgi:hypothetical protein
MHRTNSIHSLEVSWNLLILLQDIWNLARMNKWINHISLLLLCHIPLGNILWIVHCKVSVIFSPTSVKIMRARPMMRTTGPTITSCGRWALLFNANSAIATVWINLTDIDSTIRFEEGLIDRVTANLVVFVKLYTLITSWLTFAPDVWRWLIICYCIIPVVACVLFCRPPITFMDLLIWLMCTCDLLLLWPLPPLPLTFLYPLLEAAPSVVALGPIAFREFKGWCWLPR